MGSRKSVQEAGRVEHFRIKNKVTTIFSHYELT